MNKKHLILFFFVCAQFTPPVSAFAEILPQKDLGLSQNFGAIPVGASTSLHWNLRAKEADLQIQSISVNGEGFTLDTDCPVVLPAMQKCKVGLIFTPNHQGPHQALLVVDLFSDRFIIQALGEGQ